MSRKYLNHSALVLFVWVFLGIAGCEHDSVMEPKKITWQQSGLDSLGITVLAANSTGDIFAESCREGLFRSNDHGTTWTLLAPDFCLRSMAINSEGVIFAPELQLFSTFLIRSTNNGESWDSLDVAPFINIKPIAFSPSGDIFVGSQATDESGGGIFISSDQGDSWARINFADSIRGTNALAINKKGHVFAGTEFGVYRSTDHGATWVQGNRGFEEILGNPIVDALGIHPQTGDIFAALFSEGVYRLRDGEENWMRTSLSVNRIHTLVFNSKGDIFAARRNTPSTAGGVFISKDNGDNWTPINTGLTNTDVFALIMDSSGFLHAGTIGSGVFRSVVSTLR